MATIPQPNVKAEEWELELYPIGENEDDKNQSGMVVYLISKLGRVEVGRAGRVREHTSNPHVSYDRAVDRVIRDAIMFIDKCKELTGKAGELQ